MKKKSILLARDDDPVMGRRADFFSVGWEDWLWLLILAVFCTDFAFVASIRVMEHLPAFTVSISINLEPIYAILLAFVIFDEYEMWNVSFVLGASIIIAAIGLNAWYKNKKLPIQENSWIHQHTATHYINISA